MIKYKRKLLFYYMDKGLMRSTPFIIMSVESYINHVDDLFGRQHINEKRYNELMKFLC